jgi:uncharacterized delta-60 repeat protein
MSNFSTIVIGLCTAAAALCAAPCRATAHGALARVDFSGQLDDTFNDGKPLLLAIPGTTESIVNAATRLGSKIVVAGKAITTSGNVVFMVGRLNADGSPDTTFSSDGFALTNFNSTQSEEAYAVAIDGQQKIVVAGLADGMFALARYNDNGGLDTTFDADGKVLTSIPNANVTSVEGLAIDGGRIVAAGTSDPPVGSYQFTVVCYESNGTLDDSFSGDGIQVMNFPGTVVETAKAVAIDGLGRIVVTGYAHDGLNHYQIPVARLTYYGELDTEFDGDGMVFVNFSDSLGLEEANSVLIDSQNRVIIGGDSDGYFAVARLTATGALDPTFSGDGKVRTNFTSQSDERIHQLAFSGDMIVAVGAAFDSANHWKFAAAVYNEDGTLWTSFDGDGKVLMQVGDCSSFAYATVVVEDESILMAGVCN